MMAIKTTKHTIPETGEEVDALEITTEVKKLILKKTLEAKKAEIDNLLSNFIE